jgi:hypothetical protein
MMDFTSFAPLFTHITGIWVEDRGDVGLFDSNGGNVEDVTEVELGGIIIQKECVRMDCMEYDILLFDVYQALEDLD